MAGHVWTDDDGDEAILGLADLAQDFPGIEVTIWWGSNSSGPGVASLTARWEGRTVTRFSIEGLREGLLAR